MAPFAKRTILSVDTLNNKMGVVDQITKLGLKPFVVYEVGTLADKEECPRIDTFVGNSLAE
ncbi:histidine kinase osmosensor [Marasmius sp. AFHP31]|nr:histidine kinase osmosensor [Marasmius sp. AFHP31]